MTLRNLDNPTAHQLFGLTDNGSGGWLQTEKRRLKFYIRYWLCQKQLVCIRHFFAEHGLSELIQTQPRLGLRPLRPYLWGDLGASTRMDAMLAHFEWLLKQYSQEAILNFHRRNFHVLFAQNYGDSVISIELGPGRALGREGEFELHLKLNAVSVMRTAFSILPNHLVGVPESGFVMVVGNMQGRRQLNQEIKIVTQKLERTRPHNILMTALQGLAAGWKLSAIVGVSDAAHVYTSYRSLSQRVGQSYDGLWSELGTTGAVSKSHWNLPIEWVARSEQDVPSNKRSQLRRKNEIRQKIFDEVVLHCNEL